MPSNTEAPFSENGHSTHNGHGPTGHGTEIAAKQRLFRRSRAPRAATANPFSRPRNEHGDTRSRAYSYDGTVPEKGALLTQHERSLQLCADYRPLRAAQLRDRIQRVDAAIDRHGAVVEEEERSLELFNEDAAHAQDVVQTKIDDLRIVRAERETLEDEKCAACRVELAEARTEYAAQRAANGQPLALINITTPTMTEGGEDWTEDALDADGAEVNASAAAHTVPAAPGLLREGGSLLSRLFGNKRPSAPPAAPASAAADAAAPTLPKDVPFPMEDGRQQARPGEAYAHESGYPAQSAAAKIATGHPLANFLALLTCGAIFGSSIGLLLGFIDPDAMQVAASRQIGVWAVCTFFGVALFYILGCTAEAIFALISEQYHSALVATHRQDPAAVGEWLKKSAEWTAIAGTGIFVLLIGIEAVVERYGIVQLAISRMSDAIMLGHAAAPKADLQGLAAIMIALIASVPFMCYHAARGWTHARLGVLEAAMKAGHTHEAWSLARDKYAHSLEDLRAENSRIAERDEEAAQRAETAAAATRTIPGGEFRLSAAPPAPDFGDIPPAASVGDSGAFAQAHAPGGTLAQTLERPTATAPHPIPAPDEVSTLDEAPSPQETPAPQSDPANPAECLTGQIALARANERLREASIRLREAYGARRDALQPFDAQIEQLQSLAISEHIEMPMEGKRRIEDAYADILGAVQAFDRMYQDELKIIERLMRGGLFTRFRDWLFRPARRGTQPL